MAMRLVRVAPADLARLKQASRSLERADGKKVSVMEIMSAAVWRACRQDEQSIRELVRTYLADQVRLVKVKRRSKGA
jgi:hypothetical protein